MLSIPGNDPATFDVDSATRFRLAVTAAVEAFTRTGKMIDAALAYAATGVPVFPVSASDKTPVARRLLDENGDPIPGTGGFKRATTDPDQIRKWWKPRSAHLIGVPMGPRSGVWCADIDTVAGDHDHDGIGPWQALQVGHGAIKTRQHRTASDGLHELFAWSDARPVSSRGHQMPKGIDIKTDGGYIVVPPGKRKGRDYIVTCDVDPVEAPAWLLDLLPGRPRARVAEPPTRLRKGQQKQRSGLGRHIADVFTEVVSSVVLPRTEMAKFASAVEAIPNIDRHYDDWIAFILAIWASTGGSDEGRTLAERWTEKWSGKKEDLRERWNTISGSPPSETGPDKIYRAAIDAGWEWRPTKTTAKEVPAMSLTEVRERLHADFEKFVHYEKRKRNPFEEFAEEILGPRTRRIGHRIETGVGKTRTITRVIAASGKRALITVPTHKLAGEIKQDFVALGVEAEVFLGRDRPDPDNAGQQMCLALDKVEAAIASMQSVDVTCCKSGKVECEVLERCAYQAQLQKTPRVWIAASNALFHRQRVFRKVEMVIVDEGFVSKALVGVEGERVRIPLSALRDSAMAHRVDLGNTLARQKEDGGVRRGTVFMLGYGMSAARITEWEQFKALSEQLRLRPGAGFMLPARKRAAISAQMVLARRIITVLDEIENMLAKKIAVSGRLLIETDNNGSRCLSWRGLTPISKQYLSKPMLLLDATLPPEKMLKPLLPDITIAKTYAVSSPPQVFRTQVLKAPTSATKLIHGDPVTVENHRQEIRRYILQRFIETGRLPSLVIAQKPVAFWLRQQALPEAIAIEWYNNIAGVDVYGRVRLQILIGRTAPGAEAAEAQAAVFSGRMPEVVEPDGDKFSWHRQRPEGIQLRNGRVRMTMADRHPDALAEAIRFQITEAELFQADGRARPVNRDETSPLDIDWLFDVPLPGIVIDKATKWEAPSRFIDTAYSDGVMLLSPIDMTRIWPTIWPSEGPEPARTARRDVAEGVPTLPGFTEITYRPKAPKAKRRTGWFDLNRVPDPALWLAERLGVPVEVTL